MESKPSSRERGWRLTEPRPDLELEETLPEFGGTTSGGTNTSQGGTGSYPIDGEGGAASNSDKPPNQVA